MVDLYRFTQKGDYEDWVIHKDEGKGFLSFCAKHGSTRATILAISGDPDITDESEIKYSGDFYADIDSDNLTKALAATVELCEKLISLGVNIDDTNIRLSGSKGCHVIVPAKIFSSGRPLKSLLPIYRRLATELYVPGIDMSVYSAEKGRMFRPNNGKRPDGGFTVPVSFEELREIGEKEYRELVKAPRRFVQGQETSGQLQKAPGLTQLFSDFKDSAGVMENKFTNLPEESLTKLEGITPPCIEDLALGKERDNTSFNRAALNVAGWASKKLIESSRMDSLFTRISENTTSKKYSSPLARKRHLQGVTSYVGKNKKYGLSCPGMISVIKSHPCKDCPIKDSNGMVLGDHSNYEGMFVYESLGQYYSDKDFSKPIASFNMRMSCLVIGETSGKIEASVVTITSPISGYTVTINDFSEEAWTSKNNFKQEIKGLSGVVFLGNDNDVAKLRLTVTRKDLFDVTEMATKYKHSKVGVYYYRVKGPANPRDPKHLGCSVYVEKGMSIDGQGFPDSHLLVGTVRGAPTLVGRDFNAGVTKEANEAFQLLLEANNKQQVSMMLGWFLATHLKSFFHALERRFPLLFISGMAGTGKNSLTSLWMRLSGLEGEEAKYTIEAPNATKLPFQQALTSSTTVPRVINEFNRKSVSKGSYVNITELLKSAFDSQSISKGRIGGGDRSGVNVSSVEWTVTAPVIALSEEVVDTPALLQRGLKVELNKDGLKYGRRAFYELEPRADDLLSIGITLISAALKTDIKDIDQLMRETQLPDKVQNSEIPERLKFGYRVLLASYSWAIGWLAKDEGFSEENVERLESMKEFLTTSMLDNCAEIEEQAKITEVDKLLRDIAILAHYRKEEKPPFSINSPYHYVIDNNIIYLDILIIYPILQRFKSSTRETLPMSTSAAFLNAVKGADYFITDKATTPYMPFAKGRHLLKLNIAEMERAGIPLSLFRD